MGLTCIGLNEQQKQQFCMSVLSFPYRGHPCLGLAAIFAVMLYNVQFIQKSSTRNIMHVSIIILELPAKLQWVLIKWIEWGILREWPLLFAITHQWSGYSLLASSYLESQGFHCHIPTFVTGAIMAVFGQYNKPVSADNTALQSSNSILLLHLNSSTRPL